MSLRSRSGRTVSFLPEHRQTVGSIASIRAAKLMSILSQRKNIFGRWQRCQRPNIFFLWLKIDISFAARIDAIDPTVWRCSGKKLTVLPDRERSDIHFGK